VWASEIKVFKEIPGVRFDFNDSRLEEFLSFRYILGSETLIKNVFRVLPGEEVIFDLNNNQIITNNLINNCVFESKPFSSDFPALIEKTIKSQMVSAVPIGVQLSGGIDSTLVASILAKYSDHVYTYSIGMEDDSWNEFIYSDMVAKNISSIHTKITFSKEEFKKLFRDVTYYLDEPIVHPNTVPLFLLAKEARKKVKVFLTGEGADELLGGYKRYNLLVGGIYFNSFTESNIVKRILLNHCKISRRSQLFRGLKGKYIEKYFAYDIATYLPHVLLRQDKVNMAVALEARVPFLSNEISRYLYHLELSEKNGEYGQKNILKHFLKDYFKYDDQFLEREKCGFGLPIKDWLIDPEVFLEDIKNLPKQLVICTHFNVKEVENLINNHLSKKEDNSAILFTLLGLSVWYDLFIG
jgi:asparagine synthase (glutamine-hydrolysing)